MMSADRILEIAKESIATRGAERDKGSERSMSATVKAFNELRGTNLSETDGWIFMVILKLARSSGGKHQIDDYTDGASYFGLAGESAEKSFFVEKQERSGTNGDIAVFSNPTTETAFAQAWNKK